MSRLFPFILLAAFLSVPSSAVSGEYDAVDFKGLLYTMIFQYNFDPSVIETDALPEKVSARLKQYIERYGKFQSRLHNPDDSDFPVTSRFNKRQHIERSIVSLIDVKGIEDIAYNYALNAVVYYEWEGMSDGPLSEAGYAESFLARNPDTPLKPYLLLFLIHRYRCAFECLGYEKNINVQKSVSQKYQQYLKQAEDSQDILVQLIAADIDKQKYLYDE